MMDRDRRLTGHIRGQTVCAAFCLHLYLHNIFFFLVKYGASRRFRDEQRLVHGRDFIMIPLYHATLEMKLFSRSGTIFVKRTVLMVDRNLFWKNL